MTTNSEFIKKILENINNFQRIEKSIPFQRFKQECAAILNNATIGLRVRDLLPDTVIEMIHLMDNSCKNRFHTDDHELISRIHKAIKDKEKCHISFSPIIT